MRDHLFTPVSKRALFVAVFGPVLLPVSAHAILATGSLNINTQLGADRFYAAGYTGARSVVANIEAGYVSNTHVSLTSVSTYIKYSTALGGIDDHATWVGGMIAGRPVGSNTTLQEEARGIAYGATLWSGAIATTESGSTFNYTYTALAYPYVTAMQTGVNGVKADVINSSWGGLGNSYPSYYENGLIDGLVNVNGTVAVFAAGNDGPTTETVGVPATSYNVIAVASLNRAGTAVSSFSSRGPGDYRNPITGAVIQNVRAVVDLAAPGEDLYGANYNSTTSFTSGLDGTSFASPIVAGAAALVVDSGKANGHSTDGRVVKAVLMNSATKIAGWTNGQSLVNGVITTTQSLDYATGAGGLNIGAAYDQYLSGTTDITGTGGGNVRSTGWDYGEVSQNSPNDYLITQALQGGTTFTATLTWFVDRVYTSASANSINWSDNSFDNLDLQIWLADDGVATTLIAQSISLYNNTEHLSFTLPSDGDYLIRVLWTGELYDRLADANSELYALAWSGTAMIPEPAALSCLLLPTLPLRRRRA